MLENTNVLTTGVEAIQFRPDTALFDEITEALRHYSEGLLRSTEFRLKVSTSIEKHTNIKTDFKIDPSAEQNASAMPPYVDSNNPFLSRFGDTMRNLTKAHLDRFDDYVKKLNIGWVDLTKGRVYGMYADVVCVFSITRGLLTDKRITHEEKAAVILHELGHLFTYFELLGSVVSTNMALATIADMLATTEDIPRKVQLLKNAKEATRIRHVDDKAILESTNGLAIVTILRDAKLKEIRSEHGLTPYDESYSEAIADQFATRHGAGRHLVTGLSKMFKGGDPSYYGSLGRILTWIMQLVFNIIATVVSGGVFLLMMVLMGFFASVIGGEYDTTKDRFQRIRNDMVNQLKIKDIDPETRSRVLADLDSVDEVIAQVKPFYGIWDIIYKTLYTRQRREVTLKEMQQDLERLATNNLFVKAAEFKTVS